jgi:hypothetical protein
METSYGAQQMKKIMAGELAADGHGRAGVALGWPGYTLTNFFSKV